MLDRCHAVEQQPRATKPILRSASVRLTKEESDRRDAQRLRAVAIDAIELLSCDLQYSQLRRIPARGDLGTNLEQGLDSAVPSRGRIADEQAARP